MQQRYKGVYKSQEQSRPIPGFRESYANVQWVLEGVVTPFSTVPQSHTPLWDLSLSPDPQVQVRGDLGNTEPGHRKVRGFEI